MSILPPPPAPDRRDRLNFPSMMAAFLRWLVEAVPAFNAAAAAAGHVVLVRTIANNAFITVTPLVAAGTVHITTSSLAHSGTIAFVAGAGPEIQKQSAGGAFLSVTLGAIAEDTAPDGHVLVSARSQGVLEINNRSGVSRTFRLVFP